MPLDFAPDLDRFTPGVLTDVRDLVPTIRQAYAFANPPYTEGYATPVSNTDVISSAIVKDTSGAVRLYAGTTKKLLQANGATGWTDRSGTTYSASDIWSFCQFGDSTIASNGVDAVQVSTGGAFGNLSGSPPAFKIGVVHENAVVGFNWSAQRDGWYRSDTGDITDWTASAANDVDSGALRGGVGGPVVAAGVYGPLLLAWKRSAMYAGLFTGGAGGAADPKIRWDFVPGGTGIGCVSAHAWVETDLGIIFVSQRDVMLFDGGRPTSITGKVRNFLFSNLLTTNSGVVFLSHNEIEKNVYIWYSTSSAHPVAAFVYNYMSGKWGQLVTLQNGSDGSNSYVNCAVRNCNPTDYVAVGGMLATTTDTNAVFVHPSSGNGSRLVNFESPVISGASYGSAAIATMGLIGQQDRDSNFTRLIQVSGNSPPPKISRWDGTQIYDASMRATTVTNAGVDEMGNGTIHVSGRYLQPANILWTTGALGTHYEIGDLLVKTGEGNSTR